jgi:diguanylate cyclase (GGDEF)-like protein
VTLSAQSAFPDLLRNLGSLRSIPAPGTIAIHPRIFVAYGALVAAGMLTLLYVYRGRPFILYWIGSWLMVAGAVGLVASGNASPTIATLATGFAMLLGVGASALTLMAARAFPQNAMAWRTAIRAGVLPAAWFLVSALAFPVMVSVATGTVAAAMLLGWAGARYLRIAGRTRYAGAVLIGAGLVVIAVANLAGAATALLAPLTEAALGRLAAVNVITSVLVALGMHLLVFEDMIDDLRRTNRELGAAHEEVKRLAITDPLTGCHNRRFFDEIERREIQRHRRYASPMSVVFVDVNHFKRLNDTLGHDRGDEVLRTIGVLLRRQVRESDYVIRWGGDEFLLMLTCTEPEAQAKAEELKVAFGRERIAATLPDYLGLSIGVAAVSRGAETLREAIRTADSRMYRDKLSVRGQAVM